MMPDGSNRRYLRSLCDALAPVALLTLLARGRRTRAPVSGAEGETHVLPVGVEGSKT